MWHTPDIGQALQIERRLFQNTAAADPMQSFDVFSHGHGGIADKENFVAQNLTAAFEVGAFHRRVNLLRTNLSSLAVHMFPYF